MVNWNNKKCTEKILYIRFFCVILKIIKERSLLWGFFLNRGNEEFKKVLNSEIYIDKTDMLEFF